MSQNPSSAYAKARDIILSAAKHDADRLDLNVYHLDTLPPEIAQLRDLKVLDLSVNDLVYLPPEIGALTELRILHLQVNRLTSLPSELGLLTNLERLDLSHNSLSSLPLEIGQLSALKNLLLYNNRFEELPPPILNLANLEALWLGDNKLSSLPENIRTLTLLQSLGLDNNQIEQLPRQLGMLRETLVLNLNNNPLAEPLPSLVEQGVPKLFAYLRSLDDGEPQYEAKVLLVGEGNVGKSCLVAALRGEPFVKNRPTTHGIELDRLSLPHPKLNERELTLNSWDFGGQEVYRITHQFFFSRRALYLLVWRPREGQEENAIEAWLKRIRLRVGADARIIIAATHCKERSPELDFAGLKRIFGDMLVGNYLVDNEDDTGIDELREAIAREAAKLPQMGELISSRWMAARAEIQSFSHENPQIAWDTFWEVCKGHGLDDLEINTLASLLHDLGHIIHYGEDEGLRDIVVLQPEWLTKAISYVLADEATAAAGGIIEHSRLKDVWQNDDSADSYPVTYHPYFLRLMEKFDVSYRLADEDASLVGQLVPYERPALPWDSGSSLSDSRSLSLVCSMSDAAPGLVAWLTVRNHRFSAGLHWRRGVFFVHREWASEAIFELTDERHLALTVRAPSPDSFFSILRDSLEDLIKRRWEGLSYELLVPCPGTLEEGIACPGQFKFKSLMRCREQGKESMDCPDCTQPRDVGLLLTGFAPPSFPLKQGLLTVQDRLADVMAGLERVESVTAESAIQIRSVLKAVSEEITDCPRLFTLQAITSEKGRLSARLWRDHYRLTLWCEAPGHEHSWPQGTYEFSRTKDWLRSVAPYVALISTTLRVAVPVSGAVMGTLLNEEQLKGVQKEVELMKALVAGLSEVREEERVTIEGRSGLTRAEGAGLRAFRILLLEEDKTRQFGGLRRIRSSSGDFLWVCTDHYTEYDPGLPSLPK
jgi:internalin A